MSPFPVRMENHWVTEPGQDPARAQLMWFLRLGDQREVAEMARTARGRLAGITGLDLVPSQWLHMTTLVAGFADEISADQVTAMAGYARELLTAVPPARFTLGRILYHPRAIMLDARPHDALDPILAALRQATKLATGDQGRLYHNPWVPHITLAYGNTTAPAAPAIEALGRTLPEQELRISRVSLISQAPENGYTWQPVADVQVGS